jgi:hypothetical protein
LLLHEKYSLSKANHNVYYIKSKIFPTNAEGTASHEILSQRTAF